MSLTDMTWDRWQKMPEAERAALRSTANLSPQLIGLEGWRVEVVRVGGVVDRFIVGRSTGWIPCHIELRRRDSSGGHSASSEYRSVRKIELVRNPWEVR